MSASNSIPANAAQRLAAFIRKFDPTDQRLIRAVRTALRKAVSDAKQPA